MRVEAARVCDRRLLQLSSSATHQTKEPVKLAHRCSSSLFNSVCDGGGQLG